MKSKKKSNPRNNRIHIDKIHHPVYKVLTESEEVKQPFDSMKNVFLLATFLGYHQNKRLPLKDKVDIFSWDVLTRDEENVSLLRALALVVTEDIEVLTDQGRILDIAEEFANAGIIEINEKIAEMQENKVMHMVSLVGEYTPDDIILSLTEDSI